MVYCQKLPGLQRSRKMGPAAMKGQESTGKSTEMTQVIKLVGKGLKRALHITHMHKDAKESMSIMRKGRYK